MCGIVGIVSRNMISRQTVKKMNQEIFHRGPDSSGFYYEDKVGLAMRRLKVIDLSGGEQPIYNEDEKILVFFNGEIYNYLKIRQTLIESGHKFKTKSDTEILVHGYEQWGIKGLLGKIEGMFAFSIYDKNKNKLFIARDRLGEKPLYYFSDGAVFVFSSELRAILKSGLVKKEIDPVSLYYYLAIHHVPEEKTILKDVLKLPAGHYLELDAGMLKFQIRQYWRIRERVNLTSFNMATERVRNLLEKSVSQRMIADVPVGAFLSGGIDSSIIVALMSKHNSDLKTFSIGFEDDKFDESVYAKEIARFYKTDHHHFIFTEKEAIENLPSILEFMDEPIGDQALLPVFLLSREATKSVTVVLGGEGADEIFGGYDYYEQFAKNFSVKVLLNYLIRSQGNFFNEVKNETSSGFPLLTNRDDRINLIDSQFHKNIKSGLINKKLKLEKYMEEIKDPLKKAQFTDIYSWLIDDLLIKYDRMAMAVSLEGRAPYLDSELAQYAFNLPSKFKWKDGRSKYILRESFRDLLPEGIFKRKKHGFNLPMSKWLRGNLKELLLETAKYQQKDLIDNASYSRFIDLHLSGKEDRARLLYSILVYRLWFKLNFN